MMPWSGPPAVNQRNRGTIAALTDGVTCYPRWGFWKLFDRLRVEGRTWDHKHVHRVAPESAAPDDAARAATDPSAPPVLNQTWALDFMTETLYESRACVHRRCSMKAIVKGWRSRSRRRARAGV